MVTSKSQDLRVWLPFFILNKDNPGNITYLNVNQKSRKISKHKKLIVFEEVATASRESPAECVDSRQCFQRVWRKRQPYEYQFTGRTLCIPYSPIIGWEVRKMKQANNLDRQGKGSSRLPTGARQPALQSPSVPLFYESLLCLRP